MIRAVIVLFFAALLGSAWYLANAGVWGESSDLTSTSMRTGSAGVPYYGTRSVK